ncbi:hypothetical protein ACTFIR_009700 [Dictyostelium discoideum]
MDYLTHLFKNKPPLAFSTIKGHRSMLNKLLLLRNQTDVVNNPFITRLMNGIQLRSSSAKYQEICDANQVFKHSSFIKVIPKCTYTALLNKTLVLCKMFGLARSSDLVKLLFNGLIIIPDSIKGPVSNATHGITLENGEGFPLVNSSKPMEWEYSYTALINYTLVLCKIFGLAKSSDLVKWLLNLSSYLVKGPFKLGFKLNLGKNVLEPTQSILFSYYKSIRYSNSSWLPWMRKNSPGDYILLKNQTVKEEELKKFRPSWIGTFKVIRILSNNTSTSTIRFKHVNNTIIKKFINELSFSRLVNPSIVVSSPPPSINTPQHGQAEELESNFHWLPPVSPTFHWLPPVAIESQAVRQAIMRRKTNNQARNSQHVPPNTLKKNEKSGIFKVFQRQQEELDSIALSLILFIAFAHLLQTNLCLMYCVMESTIDVSTFKMSLLEQIEVVWIINCDKIQRLLDKVGCNPN